VRERKRMARRRKKARQERGWRESKGGRRGSRRGVERRPEERPRTLDGPDRRLIRGRGESRITELRVASAEGRNCVSRWGAAHPRAVSLSASAFPWAKGHPSWCGPESRGDGDRIVALHLVEEDIDASDNVFVCNRFSGAGSKQFNTIRTI